MSTHTNPRIVVHSKDNCIFCDKTKEFLDFHTLDYVIINYNNPITYKDMKNKLITETNYTQFPQIFINERFIGGYKDLINLYETTKLHDLLKEIGIILEYDF